MAPRRSAPGGTKTPFNELWFCHKRNAVGELSAFLAALQLILNQACSKVKPTDSPREVQYPELPFSETAAPLLILIAV